MIVGKFKRPPLLSQGRLYEFLITAKTVKREIIMLERDIAAEHGNVVALRYGFQIKYFILVMTFYFF